VNETENETDGEAGLASISSVKGGVMVLVRKGSRRIVVDGTVYRWRLRGRPTYFQGLAWSPCTFAVEHADTRGQTLVVTTHQPHPSNWIGREAEPVLPTAVAAAVRLAPARGLDSDGSGVRVPPRPVRRVHAFALSRARESSVSVPQPMPVIHDGSASPLPYGGGNLCCMHTR
jgi:hypothetical protein